MADSFTWLEKFGDVCAMLGEADRKELVYALAEYGMYGEEVELPAHLGVVFMALRDDIDYSKARRAGGAKGGRARAKAACAGTPSKPSEEPCEAVLEGDGCELHKVACEGSLQSVEEGACEGAAQNQPKLCGEAKAMQSIAKQSKEGRGRAGAPRFTPPAPEDVAAYAEGKGLDVDAGRFVDFYASKGWKVGREPMKDWRAAVRNWARRDADSRKEAGDEKPVFGGW